MLFERVGDRLLHQSAAADREPVDERYEAFMREPVVELFCGPEPIVTFVANEDPTLRVLDSELLKQQPREARRGIRTVPRKPVCRCEGAWNARREPSWVSHHWYHDDASADCLLELGGDAGIRCGIRATQVHAHRRRARCRAELADGHCDCAVQPHRSQLERDRLTKLREPLLAVELNHLDVVGRVHTQSRSQSTSVSREDAARRACPSLTDRAWSRAVLARRYCRARFMNDYSSFDEQRIRHLEMIQGVASRLGTNSFLVKGWAVTVSGAFLGFAIDGKKWGLALTGLLPALLFWGLDAYFLRAERLFRALHDAVRTGTPPVQPFFMGATQGELAASSAKVSWGEVVFSPTLSLFYGALAVSAVIVAAILAN
jgi:hypothetical protein